VFPKFFSKFVYCLEQAHTQHKYSFNLLKDSNEQINQKDVGHQQVAGHNGGDNPSSGFAGWESNDGSILCRDVLTTWGC